MEVDLDAQAATTRKMPVIVAVWRDGHCLSRRSNMEPSLPGMDWKGLAQLRLFSFANPDPRSPDEAQNFLKAAAGAVLPFACSQGTAVGQSPPLFAGTRGVPLAYDSWSAEPRSPAD
jgi:hypothetical protein